MSEHGTAFKFTELVVGEAALQWFQAFGYTYVGRLSIAAGEPSAQRESDLKAVLEPQVLSLVRRRFLVAHNAGRGAVYSLPGAGLPTPDDVFGPPASALSGSSEHLNPSSEHLEPIGSDDQRDPQGRLLSFHLDAPVVDALEALEPEFKMALEALATEPRPNGKLGAETMRGAILAICTGHYVTLPALADLVARAPDALRQQHLKPLMELGRLQLAFPTAPNDPRQAYRCGDPTSLPDGQKDKTP